MRGEDMFSVDRAPRYVAETWAAAARMQEQTTADQYAALFERAQRLVDGMFTVETNVDPDLQAKIALREKFEAPRVKQAILMVATWQLVTQMANAWNVRKTAAAAAPARPLAALAAK